MTIVFQLMRAKYSGQAKGPEKKIMTPRQSGSSYWNGWGSRVLSQNSNIITHQGSTPSLDENEQDSFVSKRST